jgi:hypothetical protein
MVVKLSVRVFEAANLPKFGSFSPDSYCTITMSDQPDSVSTRVVTNSTNPRWHQGFQLRVLDPATSVMRVEVWDRSFPVEDLLGRRAIPVAGIPPDGELADWFDLDAPPGVAPGARIRLEVRAVADRAARRPRVVAPVGELEPTPDGQKARPKRPQPRRQPVG